jgi:hypothetical protein
VSQVCCRDISVSPTVCTMVPERFEPHAVTALPELFAGIGKNPDLIFLLFWIGLIQSTCYLWQRISVKIKWKFNMELWIGACKSKLISWINVSFLDETTKLWKETVSCIVSPTVYLSVCSVVIVHRISQATRKRFSWNLTFDGSVKYVSKKFILFKIWQKIRYSQ